MALADLFEVLDRMVEVHEQLLELADQKKQAIIDNQIADLTQVLSKESRLMKRVQELEQDRMKWMLFFLKEKNLPTNPNTTISDLAKIVVKIDDKAALLNSQSRLVHTINEIKRANELNQKLIEQSLAFINYSFDLILGPDEDPIYHKSAQPNSSFSQRNGYFDTKA